MNLTYKAAQNISYFYFKLFHQFKIEGLQNIPKNHVYTGM